MAKGKRFGGKRFKKGKITVDVSGKTPTELPGLTWKEIRKKKLW